MSTAIYKAIKDNNKTVIELARDYGVTRSTVYQSIDGGGSRSVRVKLSLLANISPTRIWGNLHQYQLDELFYEKKGGAL